MSLHDVEKFGECSVSADDGKPDEYERGWDAALERCARIVHRGAPGEIPDVLDELERRIRELKVKP